MIDDQLRDLICATADQHPHMGAEELATLVAGATPAERVGRYYRDLLSGTVRTVVNQHRRQPNPPQAKPQPQPKPTPPSPKLEQRRSWWQEALAREVHVGGGISKSIGDCTADDLEFCIKERDAAIERIEEQLGNLRRFLALLRVHDATTVGELPEQTSWREQ